MNFSFKNNLSLSKQLPTVLPDLLVAGICLLSFIFSVIESRLNVDAHHWGLMYANAIDLDQGLTPFKEIFIQYGILTTLIQSLSLKILGNYAVSIGVITGVFYSINIYLSYLLWQKILNKWLSFLSACLMFLLHGYIVFPWANYFSYTFLLLCLLCLLNASNRGIYYFIAGLLFAFNVLCRQTAFLSSLIPIYGYFIIDYFCLSQKEKSIQVKNIRNIVLFHVGIGLIFAFFFLYLFKTDSLQSWYLQNFKILSLYRNMLGGVKAPLFQFISSIFIAPFLDFRLLIYSLILFISIFWGIRIIVKALEALKNNSIKLTDQDNIILLFSNVTFLGFTQALHSYELFRLQSASSIGLGLLTLSGLNLTRGFQKPQKFILLGFLGAIGIYLSGTLVGVKSSSVYYTWPKSPLFNPQLQQPDNIKIFQGKLFNPKVKLYYESLANAIKPYHHNVEYLVNFTRDSYLLYISDDFKKVQSSPYYADDLIDNILLGEKDRINQVIDQKNAIYFAQFRKPKDFRSIPDNYCIVFLAQKPKEIRFMSKTTYVVAPKKLSSKCLTPNIPKV